MATQAVHCPHCRKPFRVEFHRGATYLGGNARPATPATPPAPVPVPRTATCPRCSQLVAYRA